MLLLVFQIFVEQQFMRVSKNLCGLFLIAVLLALPTFAQRRKPFKRAAKPAAASSNGTAVAAFEAIKTATDANQRIEKLNEFIVNFPQSDLKPTAVEFLIVSHVQVGENDFQTGDAANGIEEFKNAAKAFDGNVSDKLYNDIVAKLPYNVFFRAKLPEERRAAIEIAKSIEPKVNNNAARLLGLANFHLAAENAADARRLAQRVIQIEPNLAEAQTVLGMANRIDFKLEDAVKNYRRAVELDPASLQSKRNLADVQRGLGQNAQALELYRELLTANPNDEAARAGLILALFNSKQKDQAEQELATALQQNPKNFQLQTNAAYWYAANGDAAKAVELATQAAATEPRYVWAQIALARGLILQKNPLEAERALLFAKQFGNFPTLDYELANAHYAAGLFDEARDDLSRSFAFKKGKLTTKLAGRTDAAADDFNQLLSAERRASTFQFESASSADEAEKLKELLILSGSLGETAPQIYARAAAVKFADGADELQTHRQLYAATRLLNSKKALPTAAELIKAATGNVEKSLDVPSATAAVLADELYEPRRAALLRGQVVNVPTLDRETLSRILRGRIEELAGLALFQENEFNEAAVRLRRAVGILPQNSAWWRSSLWKLGVALDAAGKPREALDPLVTSYKADQPSDARLAVVQAVYQRANNGSLNGFERFVEQPNAAPNKIINSRAGNVPSQPNAGLRSPQPTAKNPLPSVIAEIVTKKEEPATIAAEEPKTAAVAAVEPKPTVAPPAVQKTELKTLPPPDEMPAPAAAPEIIRQPQTAPVQETVAQTGDGQSAVAETAPVRLPLPPANNTFLEKPIEKPAEKLIEPPVEKTLKEPLKKAEIEVVAAEKSEQNVAPRVVITPLTNVEMTPPTKIEISEGKSIDISPSATAIEAKPPQTPASTEPATVKIGRPRVVVQNLNQAATANQNGKNQLKSESANQPCALQLSSKQISLFRNGGKAVLIAAASSAELAAQIKFSVSSPTDLAIVPQETADTNDFSRMFEIRSTSEITKNFVITFELPCAKQEVLVKVK